MIKIPGVPNLHQVNDNLWRSGQPTLEGLGYLQHQVKTIVNLRAFHEDDITGLKLKKRHLWFKTWHPEIEDIRLFLQYATDPTMWPVLVHCKHGSDRTGLMVAIYRIVVDGWTKEKALDEMKDPLYGFHWIWINIPWFIRRLDIEQLKH